MGTSRSAPVTGPYAARSPNYGRGEYQMSLREAIECDPDVLTDRLRATLQGDGWQPPLLPDVAVEVNQLASDPSVTAEVIAATVARDPVLSAQVVRLANSPVFRCGPAVQSLQAAVVQLGARGLRNIVLQVSLNMRVFRSRSFQPVMASVRSHSVAAAHIAHHLARHGDVDPDDAFLAGLLHDIGMAAALLVLGQVAKRGEFDVARVWNSVVACHEEAGAVVARRWGLSGAVLASIEGHHGPSAGAHPMASVTTLAEHFASLLGRDVRVPGIRRGRSDPTPASVVVDCARRLGIEKTEIRRAYAEAGAIIELVG